MNLMDGALARAFADAFSPLYLDATLHRASHSEDSEGGGSTSWTDEPVKAQLDYTTEAMRAAEGYRDTDQRILVLAHGVEPIDSDCEITVAGQRWAIASVSQDPCGAYFELRGRRA
jgi:hypothetical protein